MNREFNLIEAIRILLKWKWQIVILTATSAVIAAVFALFVMDEYYYSWSTFYPTNQAMTDRTSIFNTESAQQMEYFGGKGDINRILTIANSVPVIQSIIDSFDLPKHYDIAKDRKYWRTEVRKKFEKNYSAIRTEHDAVEISVYDTDPKVAAAIVNSIVSKIDRLNKQHIADTKRKVYNLIGKQVSDMQQEVINYNDTLANLGEEYRIKVTQGTDGGVIVDGSNYKAVQLYKSLLSKQSGIARELNNLTSIRGQMEVTLENNESSLFVLEEAFAADRRSKPVRWLVVVVTTFMVFFISIIGVLLIEQIRDIKEQL